MLKQPHNLSNSKFMVTCGLKLTHDGAVAVVENGRLRFSVELEKINNNPRYSSLENTAEIAGILRQNGCDLRDIDHFVLDGWGGFDQDALAIQPRLEIGPDFNYLTAENEGKPYRLEISQYREKKLEDSILNGHASGPLLIGDHSFRYTSYLHVTGHVMGTYATSPFAARGESAYILVWDGGMYPRLYYFDVSARQIENLGPIFLLIGNIYSIFAQHFGPFKVAGGFAKDNLSVAGKVMAYIALGEVRKELFPIFDDVYIKHYQTPMGFANVFAKEVIKRIDGTSYSDEDILRSFHQYLEELLVHKLVKKIQRNPRPYRNICLAGGCALNIKWNRRIRDTGFFEGVYVPPFPNDSGSAIGMACVGQLMHTGVYALDWSVYAGPEIADSEPAGNWEARPCTLKELALLLQESEEPVVFLNGRAELGPRALGNRSILASPFSPGMKDILNQVKKREPYRPVSPICLEAHAPDIFNPGTPDPYMLFDHLVRPEWSARIPAVCHLDGTARLQTVNHSDNPVVAELIEAFYALTGVPLLCNTSANHLGCGFFPDVHSATAWNKVNYVWCSGTLYRRKEMIPVWQLANASQSQMV